MHPEATIPMELLSPADAAWLHMERPTNPMTITGVFLFDEPLGFAQLQRLIEERLLRHKRLKQRPVESTLHLARPHWEDDPLFDLRAHLHRMALPPPGDDTALREMVSDLMSTRLDLSRPLWHFYLIEGYGEGCAVLTRMHHCLGDGASLTQLLMSIVDAEAGEPGPAEKPPAPHASALDRVLHAGMDLLSHPGHILDLAKLGLSGTLSLGKLLLLPPDPKTLFKGPLGVFKRAAWSEPLALDGVKSMAHALGGTVNDVLLSAMTGALRRYLLGRGSTADKSIRAIVPVNLRASSPVPEFGNHFGLIFLSLPLEIDDARLRFTEVKRRMDEIKATPESHVAFTILEALGATAQALENVGVEMFSAKGSLVMTNVPGPRRAISLGGHPIRSLVFWAPQSGDIGLGISLLSYAGEVRLGVNTDALLVPDPERIVESFVEEFAALAAIAAPRKNSRRKHR